ncbi:MAG: TatD family deoxyribonuclease [Verrucomicrobia bacterium]|nr:TatD family deoxyribonuclease [Verrucomicrobiota bacterium]
MESWWYDTHAHLDFPDFSGDLEAVLQRARAAGVSRIVTIGTDLASSERAIGLTGRYAGLFAAAGWHPGHVEEAPDDIRETLRTLAKQPGVCALGETGMDFYRLPSGRGGTVEDDALYKARQARLFEQHLEVAAETGLNCVIHTRDSMEATLEIFRAYASRVRAVFHCFVGSVEELKAIMDLGSLVSFTGIVTFKNAATVAEAVKAAPRERFMVETDAPFLSPVPYRGKRCEPAYAALTGQRIAELRGEAAEDVARRTCLAAHEFFRGFH